MFNPKALTICAVSYVIVGIPVVLLTVPAVAHSDSFLVRMVLYPFTGVMALFSAPALASATVLLAVKELRSGNGTKGSILALGGGRLLLLGLYIWLLVIMWPAFMGV